MADPAISAAIRDALEEAVAASHRREVALFLSSGMDSLACGLAAARLGMSVTAYAFSMAGRESTDLVGARRAAATFGWKFVPVALDPDLDHIVVSIAGMKARHGVRTKAQIECVYPFVESEPFVTERVVITGHAADGYFGVSKRAMIHFRERLDEWRSTYFGKKNVAQTDTLREVFGTRQVIFPYITPRMFEVFRGATWDVLNRPKQKQVIVDAYPDEFARVRVAPHLNLQLGDSGIASTFAKLLDSPHNTHGAKAVVGIYNRL